MLKYLLGILMANILLFQSAYARKTYVKVDKTRMIEVEGEIRKLEKQATKLLKLSNKATKKPVYIILDTPGGSVVGGLALVQAIDRVRSRGTPVVCLVTGMSMSMGMHIMSACSKNYAFPTSLLMHHDVAAYVAYYKITKKQSAKDGKQLALLGDYLDARLLRRLGVKKKLFNEYQEGEYIQYGVDFKKYAPNFLKIIDDIRISK